MREGHGRLADQPGEPAGKGGAPSGRPGWRLSHGGPGLGTALRQRFSDDVSQSSLAELANRATPGVWVRTPQAEALRDALASRDVVAEAKSDDTVVALSTTTDTVGLIAAGAGVGVVIYEMTAQRFDLEELFLELTTTTGELR